MSGNALNYSMTIEIQAPITRLWPLLSDTDRVNRMLGLPASEQINPNADGSRTINGHFLGVAVSWREHPFEWIFEQWFEVTRVFEPPFPVEKLITRTVFVPISPDATRIEVSVYQTARSALGGGPARLFVEQKFLRDMRRVYRQLGQIAAETTDYVPPPPLITPTVNTGRLERAAQRLRDSGVREGLIKRLVQHLRSADDPDVIKIRPFVLADRWSEPRLETLRAFLYATRGGLLDLEWDVICPNCRGASVRAGRMSDLAGQAHCPSCQIRYDVDFEESVELRFSVSADIRNASDATFCSGGPANTRHILSQIWVEPQSTRKVQIRLDSGNYRLRSGQIASRALLAIAPEGSGGSGLIRFNTQTIEAPDTNLTSGNVELVLQNESNDRILIVFEQSAWNLQAASAALVTALDEFRQMFSSEILAPGLGIAIRTLTFLFSDLKDSTQIYDQIGDTLAYARVRDHFNVMRGIIAQNNGALVKTIGDAVMAVFRTAEDAMKTAIEIQREFGSGPIAQVNPTLRVKLGLHSGPCIAVNANDLLDYFGSTVNIAARVQSESIGGDIVVTDAILGDPGVQEVVEAEQITSESFERSLKGFSRSFTLARLWLPVEQQVEAIVSNQ